jgi:hypothetical protein
MSEASSFHSVVSLPHGGALIDGRQRKRSSGFGKKSVSMVNTLNNAIFALTGVMRAAIVHI